uniref:Uncharacterized protein n=1 Tax=Oryza meridionalis TaxID=40149 RepID=A0A0E0E6F0_9ORYZ
MDPTADRSPRHSPANRRCRRSSGGGDGGGGERDAVGQGEPELCFSPTSTVSHVRRRNDDAGARRNAAEAGPAMARSYRARSSGSASVAYAAWSRMKSSSPAAPAPAPASGCTSLARRRSIVLSSSEAEFLPNSLAGELPWLRHESQPVLLKLRWSSVSRSESDNGLEYVALFTGDVLSLDSG